MRSNTKGISTLAVMILLAAIVAPSLMYLLKKQKSISPTQKSEAGKVILIAGTSSSGKSSIINELQKIYGNTYQVIKIDDFDFDALKTIEKQATEWGWNSEKVKLNDFMDEYVLKQTGRNIGLPSELRTDAAIKIYKEIQDKNMHAFFQHVHDVAIKSKNVIVDTVFDYANFYDIFFDMMHDQQIVKVLVYLPLEVIAQRVEARNKSGKKEEERSVFQAVAQFPAFYKVQESNTEPIVDVIQSNGTKQLLKKVLDTDYHTFIQGDLPLDKITELKTEFDAFYQAFVERFKLDTLKEIVLAPKKSWDLIVNTSIHSPTESAHIIAEYLKK